MSKKRLSDESLKFKFIELEEIGKEKSQKVEGCKLSEKSRDFKSFKSKEVKVLRVLFSFKTFHVKSLN